MKNEIIISAIKYKKGWWFSSSNIQSLVLIPIMFDKDGILHDGCTCITYLE